MENKINTGFGRLSDSALKTEAQVRINCMTGNPDFPEPHPELDVAAAATIDFSNAVITARTGTKTDVAIKNQKREVLVTALVALSVYVAYKAKGNLVMITGAGFTVAKTPAAQPPLEKPEGLLVVDGANNGELTSSVRQVKGAKAYLHQCTPDPVAEGSVWQSQNSTTARYTFTGLVSGQKYWFRVAAIGTQTQVVFSDAVCRVAQ